ncbi:hypothetical protein [Acidaminococcus fermentans]|uniref:hypothetical protein n=1 Tax=Acidaminococcus fermentans TaxID=905 RepID=UPI002491E2E8|nr:hypothetical protein [Acidaminococcus fermentans]
MTHLNITLDQEEILALLSENYDGACRKLLLKCLNKVLQRPFQLFKNAVDGLNT